MSQPLRNRLAGLATLAALLSAGSALAQSVPAASVRIFEEPPPMELLRSIMVPESRSGLTRRIVLGAPDQSAPLASPSAAPERSAEAAPIAPAPRRTRPQGNASSAMVAAAGLVSPLPAPVPELARPAPATSGSIGFLDGQSHPASPAPIRRAR